MNSHTITGKISRANGTGLLLEGESRWRNISKYAQPAPAMPQRGQLATLVLDGQGFIRNIEVAAPPAPITPSGQPETASASTPPERERVISRLAVLNSATAILASGGRSADPTEVLRLAAQLETWAYR